MRFRSEYETKLRETVPEGVRVLGYGRNTNKLDVALGANTDISSAKWDYIKVLSGNCDVMLYSCNDILWESLEKYFDRPWEQEASSNIKDVLEECEKLKRENKGLTEQNINLATRILRLGEQPRDTSNYHYTKGYAEGKQAGALSMEYKRGKMQSQRDQLAKVLGDIVQLTPAKVREVYLRSY
jgi:hypothetical protein